MQSGLTKKIARGNLQFALCKSRLRGVTEWGCKGEADGDPCERVPGPPPFVRRDMFIIIIYYEIKVRRIKVSNNIILNNKSTILDNKVGVLGESPLK